MPACNVAITANFTKNPNIYTVTFNSNGIIQGIRDDVLSPANLATRAQVAVMLDRFIDLIQ